MPGTKERILDAAERLFAERGYNATSLRAITSKAQVNLAAVNYHFNSKDALIQAVFARRMGPLNKKRLALLDACEADAGDGPVSLERVLRALIAPVLRLGSDSDAGGHGFKMLVGRMFSEPTDNIQKLFTSELGEVVPRFRSAFRRALPDLPSEDLFWRIHFTIGALAHTLAAPSMLRILSDGRCDPLDVDGAIERLTAFTRGGLAARVASKRKGMRKKLSRGKALSR